jgi:hypothetical protein
MQKYLIVTLSLLAASCCPDSGEFSVYGFFLSGVNLAYLVLLAFLVYISWHFFLLRRKISGIYRHVRKFSGQSGSANISRDLEQVIKRLKKIELELTQLKAGLPYGSAPANDHGPENNDRTDTADAGDGSLKYSGGSGRVIFFMPAPDNEGNFDHRRKSDHFIPSESVYRFEMETDNDDTAEFSICHDPNNMERAINYYSSILEKVCRAENAFNPSGKTIRTIKPGIAVLNNNKWTVKEKALVRYD